MSRHPVGVIFKTFDNVAIPNDVSSEVPVSIVRYRLSLYHDLDGQR